MEQPEFDILGSCYKHGITEADIRHALRNIVRYRESETANEVRMLIIGPSESGGYLELVAVPAEGPQRVIHADRLRPKFYDLL